MFSDPWRGGVPWEEGQPPKQEAPSPWSSAVWQAMLPGHRSGGVSSRKGLQGVGRALLPLPNGT